MATIPTLPALQAPEPTLVSRNQAAPNSAGPNSAAEVLPSPVVALSAPRALEAPRLLALWHLTSLDAPTVAVVWCLAFGWAAKVHLPWWLPTILGLFAWAFYITDRLLDARGAARAAFPNSNLDRFSLNPGLRPRHHFHWKHRCFFIPIALAATLTAIALVLHDMPPVAQTRNSILALVSIAYLTSVHTRHALKIPKELLVAIVFTAACTLPVIVRTPMPHLTLVPAILAFTALAWLNCQAIETWESTTREPTVPIGLISMGIALLALLLAAITAFQHNPRPAALLGTVAMSALALALLDQFKPRLAPTTLRAAADLALLTPLFLLAIR